MGNFGAYRHRKIFLFESILKQRTRGRRGHYNEKFTRMGSEGCAGKLLEINNADEDRWLCPCICVWVQVVKSIGTKRKEIKEREIKRSRYEEIENVLEEGWRGYGGGGEVELGGWGTTMGRQFQFQFQDFVLSKIFFLPSLSSFTPSHLLLSLILTNSSSPICIHLSLFFFYYLFLSLSHLIQLSSFFPFIPAVCSSKSDFYTTNWFPISISVLCRKIRSLSFVLHSLLGRRNLIVWWGGWYILHLWDLLCI